MTKYTIKGTSKYKKGLKLSQKRGCDLNILRDVIDQLAQGIPLDDKYVDHPLNPPLKDHRGCHLKPNWILVYIMDKESMVLVLTNIGTHEEVY